MSSSNFPISDADLTQLATEACISAVGSATAYDHSQASRWNTQIINTILKSLIAAPAVSAAPAPPYKFIVQSTVLQNMSGGGARGMNSASGAFWNDERDGMFSYKFDGAERGFDFVVSVAWVAISSAGEVG